MRFKSIYLLSVLWSFSLSLARPLVKSIDNQTSYVYLLSLQNRYEGCVDNNKKSRYFFPHRKRTTAILLAEQKPSLVLKPIGYISKKNHKIHYFADVNGVVHSHLLKQAFAVWKKEHRNSVKNEQDWLHEWIGGDIVLTHNDIEVFGYLLNINLAKIENNNYVNHTMLSLSEGLFSRLMIKIIIEKHNSKGIRPKIEAFVGQGGICRDGEVIEL